jgi:RNA polymerase sigma-70 factor (ECF subfamily)
MSAPPPDDQGVAWMLAWQAGDEQAFDRLVETYSGPVWRLLTRFLGTSPDREDLLQDVFLRVLRARERYRPTARFTTWLYRITFNLCVNARARLGGSESSIDELGEGDGRRAWEEALADRTGVEPWHAMERADVVRAVRTAIAALPERQRMALVLARYEGLSFAEIGEVMDASDRAIKSLVHRAREALRATLAPYLAEERP